MAICNVVPVVMTRKYEQQLQLLQLSSNDRLGGGTDIPAFREGVPRN